MPKKRRKRKSAAPAPRIPLTAAAALLVMAVFFLLLNANLKKSTVYSASVLKHRPAVERAARQEKILPYADILLAIVQVESNGEAEDVMQSSESLGLKPNTLDTEASIDQGCKYFAELLREAARQGADTNTAVQAYNYGITYIPYVAQRGGTNTRELAEAFAKEHSGGKTKPYTNPLAAETGGWRYAYGNMFYAELVNGILTNRRKELMLSTAGAALVFITAAGLLLAGAAELLRPDFPLLLGLFNLKAADVRKKRAAVLLRTRGFENCALSLLLLYGAIGAVTPREFCGAVLILMIGEAVCGAVLLDPLVLFVRGIPAAVSLSAVLLSGGLPMT